MQICTRFAPSPTGYLHIGSVRTALYCYLYAKRFAGKYILRIEDTDRERSTDEATQIILDGMTWLGLTTDEGPFFQTQRFARYAQVLQQFLAEGKAYRCYCSKERLTALREQQMANKQKPRYDGHCRELNCRDSHAPHVIRFKNPLMGEVIIDDMVLGQVVVQNSELDDLIIARSDGTPTYNFTVVVDDSDMQITHVIRGNDHLNNTPRQINLLRALGAKLPRYAHIPMILGEDGKKLSKRHGAISVMQYRDQGYLPEALMNYLVRLGWSHGDQEIFSLAEMIEHFDIKDVNKAAATFDSQKLDWLNQHYLKTLPEAQLVAPLAWQFQQLGIETQQGPALEALIIAQRERCKTLKEMAEKSCYFYQNISHYDKKAAEKHLTLDVVPVLGLIIEKLQSLPVWDKGAIHQVIKDTAEQLTLKMGKVAQPMRVALTGNTISPSIDVTVELLGQDITLNRLVLAIEHIQKMAS